MRRIRLVRSSFIVPFAFCCFGVVVVLVVLLLLFALLHIGKTTTASMLSRYAV